MVKKKYHSKDLESIYSDTLKIDKKNIKCEYCNSLEYSFVELIEKNITIGIIENIIPVCKSCVKELKKDHTKAKERHIVFIFNILR